MVRHTPISKKQWWEGMNGTLVNQIWTYRSAPSAIGTVGGGFGGQIGFELTDFVFILNDSMAVKTFAQVGSLTLGGNVSIAAGPVGRNAEAAGAASLKSVSGIFAYSKTKGLFAGVTLEGSVLIERATRTPKCTTGKSPRANYSAATSPSPPKPNHSCASSIPAFSPA